VIFLIIGEYIDIKVHGNFIKHLISKGYENCKHGDIIKIKISDLSSGMSKRIPIQCDYCGKVFDRKYKDHIKIQKTEILNKDACKKCRSIKEKEVVLVKYGVDNVMKLEEFKGNLKNTMMEKYGVEYASQNPEVVEKFKQTMLERYGEDNPQKVKSIQEKSQQTNLKKYGAKHPLQSKEIYAKMVETNERRYGVKNVLQKFSNNSASRQQIYINELMGGELNYIVDKYILDIAFPKTNVVIEYSGSGHDLSVQLKRISKLDFLIKEWQRTLFLNNMGWKILTIESKKDYLPEENILKNDIDNAINMLLTNEAIYNLKIIINKDNYNNLKKLPKIENS
jgi:very-short-patch-repair endonuclease